MSRGRVYPESFKREAVAQVIEHGYSVNDVSTILCDCCTHTFLPLNR